MRWNIVQRSAVKRLTGGHVFGFESHLDNKSRIWSETKLLAPPSVEHWEDVKGKNVKKEWKGGRKDRSCYSGKTTLGWNSTSISSGGWGWRQSMRIGEVGPTVFVYSPASRETSPDRLLNREILPGISGAALVTLYLKWISTDRIYSDSTGRHSWIHPQPPHFNQFVYNCLSSVPVLARRVCRVETKTP